MLHVHSKQPLRPIESGQTILSNLDLLVVARTRTLLALTTTSHRDHIGIRTMTALTRIIEMPHLVINTDFDVHMDMYVYIHVCSTSCVLVRGGEGSQAVLYCCSIFASSWSLCAARTSKQLTGLIDCTTEKYFLLCTHP